jgi:hypothetical protein
MNNANFEKARQLYEQAFQVLNLGVAKKGILSSLEKIASMYFENNQFELSREYYDLLLREDVSNVVYQERYKISKNELLFEQLVEKGDGAYFTYQYPIALDNYQQALKIKRDNLVSKRKEECERFIERERKLREELEKQMTEKLTDELKYKVEAQIKSKIEEEMRAKKEEMLDKMQQEVRTEVETSFKQELEDSFWSRVTVWNTIEAYQFYKGFFPNGKHSEKASRRIEELKTRQQTKVEKPIEVDTNTTVSQVVENIASKEESKTVEAKTDASLESTAADKKVENVQSEHKATRIRLSEVIHREDVKNAIPPFDKKEASESEAKEEEILPTKDAILAKSKSEKEEVVIKAEPVKQEPTKSTKPDFGSMSDKDLWMYAKNKGTIRGFMTYIENTKEYAHVADAYFEINQLKRKGFSIEDEPAEEAILETATTSKTSDFQQDTSIKTTNSVPTKPKNEPNFEAMSEDELWRYAEKENTVESYRNYVEYTKASLHVADAYYLINQLSKQSPAPKIEEKVEVVTKIEEKYVAPTKIVEEEPQIERPEEKANLQDLENALKNFRQEDYMPKKKEATLQKSENFGFSDGEIERVKRMSEEELWAWVQSKNTVDAYRAYVEFSQESSHVADAYYIINQLTHKEELEVIPTTNYASTYSEPVFEKFEAPTPSYSNPYSTETSTDVSTSIEVENHSAISNEEEIWEKAQSENSIGAYFNYLNATIEKKYWDEAKKRINELKNNSQAQEQVDWDKAQKDDSVDAYKNYIRKYPLGNYYAKAMFRLNKLESETNS